MVDCYIAARSVTYAQKLVRVMNASGVRARLTKSPKEILSGGCGHAVLIRNNDPARIWTILSTSGLPPFRVFLTTDNKNFREYLGY